MIELIASDLLMIKTMFDVLESAAKITNVSDVRIVFKGDGDTITIGFGQHGEPAVLCVEPET